MKILFSCSESKTQDTHNRHSASAINIDSFAFPDAYPKRLEILSKYQSALQEGDDESLKAIFGIKKEALLEDYKGINIFKDPTKKAVERYDGVGYQYLDYASLEPFAKSFIDDNVFIFSNLFGIIQAKDTIPFYKLKQGKKLDGISIDTFYRNLFQSALDEILDNELIIDLRANSYEKFYNINDHYHLKIKFIKEGKTISHYSKAYRGKLLRAINQNPAIKDIHHILKMRLDDMEIIDVADRGKETLIIYECKG